MYIYLCRHISKCVCERVSVYRCCFLLSLDLLLLFALFYKAMGSYGDEWLWCCKCWRWGKCMWPEYLPPNVPALWDIDNYGLVCDLCFDDAYPQLTLPFFRGKFPVDVADLIESFAYPEWARIQVRTDCLVVRRSPATMWHCGRHCCRSCPRGHTHTLAEIPPWAHGCCRNQAAYQPRGIPLCVHGSSRWRGSCGT